MPRITPSSASPRLATVARLAAVVSLIFLGAIFGFYYAWVCSTMWGLDNADPRTAIAAMQAMNASVRNPVFSPVFFGTPIVVLATATVAWLSGQRRGALGFAAAGLLVLLGSVVFTAAMNLPLNEALAQVAVPEDVASADAIWTTYSTEWQSRNITRTVLTGLALTIGAIAALGLVPAKRSAG